MTCGALFCKPQGAVDSLTYEKQPGSEILCGKDTGLPHPALHGVSTQKQSSDVHGAEGSVFQHTPPPAPLYSSNQEGAIKDQTYRTYRACCWAHRLFPQHLKDSCLGFRQG